MIPRSYQRSMGDEYARRAWVRRGASACPEQVHKRHAPTWADRRCPHAQKVLDTLTLYLVGPVVTGRTKVDIDPTALGATGRASFLRGRNSAEFLSAFHALETACLTACLCHRSPLASSIESATSRPQHSPSMRRSPQEQTTPEPQHPTHASPQVDPEPAQSGHSTSWCSFSCPLFMLMPLYNARSLPPRQGANLLTNLSRPITDIAELNEGTKKGRPILLPCQGLSFRVRLARL